MSMRRFMRWYYIVPAALVAAPLFIALFVLAGGGIVMLLWNWLLPPLFDWPAITLWQGFGLLVLCRILFGGFGERGPGVMTRFRAHGAKWRPRSYRSE
jgi:hypothetical protein